MKTCLTCEKPSRPDSNYCGGCWNGVMLRSLRRRPLGERAAFLGIVGGMIKDAGYSSPRDFARDLKLAWPHIKECV